MMIVIALLLIVRRPESMPDVASEGPSPTEAAALATRGDSGSVYEFSWLKWQTPRQEMRESLKARGFSFVEQDADGDDQFRGRVDGRDAAVVASYAGDKVARHHGDPAGARRRRPVCTEGIRLSLGRRLRESGETERPGHALARARGTLVWTTITDDRLVKINYEAADWPAEARRRKRGGKEVAAGSQVAGVSESPGSQGLRAPRSQGRWFSRDFSRAVDLPQPRVGRTTPKTAGGDRRDGVCRGDGGGDAGGRPSPRPTRSPTARAAAAAIIRSRRWPRSSGGVNSSPTSTPSARAMRSSVSVLQWPPFKTCSTVLRASPARCASSCRVMPRSAISARIDSFQTAIRRGSLYQTMTRERRARSNELGAATDERRAASERPARRELRQAAWRRGGRWCRTSGDRRSCRAGRGSCGSAGCRSRRGARSAAGRRSAPMRTTAESRLTNAGPIRMLRPAFPNVNGGAITKARPA